MSTDTPNRTMGRSASETRRFDLAMLPIKSLCVPSCSADLWQTDYRGAHIDSAVSGHLSPIGLPGPRTIRTAPSPNSSPKFLHTDWLPRRAGDHGSGPPPAGSAPEHHPVLDAWPPGPVSIVVMSRSATRPAGPPVRRPIVRTRSSLLTERHQHRNRGRRFRPRRVLLLAP